MASMTPALLDAMRRINELLRIGSFRAAHDQLETIVGANPGFVEALRLLAGTKRSEEHTSELQSQSNLVCRLLLEKKKNARTIAFEEHTSELKTQSKLACPRTTEKTALTSRTSVDLM